MPEYVEPAGDGVEGLRADILPVAVGADVRPLPLLEVKDHEGAKRGIDEPRAAHPFTRLNQELLGEIDPLGHGREHLGRHAATTAPPAGLRVAFRDFGVPACSPSARLVRSSMSRLDRPLNRFQLHRQRKERVAARVRAREADASSRRDDDAQGGASASRPTSAPTTALARRDAAPPPATAGVGWEFDAQEDHEDGATQRDHSSHRATPLTAEVMSLLSDPRIRHLSVESAAQSLGRPRTDVQTAIEALVQAGELHVIGTSTAAPRYSVSPDRKAELEQMFRDAASDLGEARALARFHDGETALMLDDEDEPRLPVTAGLLSLFLPGTGQLLNGDVGRASLVFAVWSLALLTHLSPIWTFVALYAGAEAFFTAKIKGLERKLAVEQASLPSSQAPAVPAASNAPRLLGPRGPSQAPST